MKANQMKLVASAVALMFGAYNGTLKTDRADYDAVAKCLKAAPLNDAEYLKAMREQLTATFGEAHKDAAQIRWNIIRNARRVAYGGTADGKAIRGKGMPAMLDIVASVTSVRELKRALADAVPEQLKGKSGGDRKSGKGKGKANPLKTPGNPTREQAFAAAKKILEFCRDKFVKPSETDITLKLNAACEALDKAAKPEPATK
jgi:hypothetical protein